MSMVELDRYRGFRGRDGVFAVNLRFLDVKFCPDVAQEIFFAHPFFKILDLPLIMCFLILLPLVSSKIPLGLGTWYLNNQIQYHKNET